MGQKVHQHPQRIRGFTLIELLAVVAIIILLLSLLVPAMHKVRDRANQIVCESNVRQVMTAIIHQSSDNEGFVTSPNWGTQDQAGWLSYKQRWDDLTPLSTGLLWPYLGSYKVYRCPGDPQPDSTLPWFNQNSRMVTSYNMNGSACGYGAKGFISAAKGWNTFKLTEYRPSDIIYWEGNENAPTMGYWWDGGNYPWEGMSSRHYDGGTLASADAHVERMDTTNYYAMSGSGNKNRLWNRPDTANGH
jgi:prepilin-type N-terminal cleavage/methylation domain-containing protein